MADRGKGGNGLVVDPFPLRLGPHNPSHAALPSSSYFPCDCLQGFLATGKLRLSDDLVGFRREVVGHDVAHAVAAPPWEAVRSLAGRVTREGVVVVGVGS